jgi:hypothetical protein
MMTIQYVTYQRMNGDGPDYHCAVYENGKSLLMFSEATAHAAETAAREWANRVLETPERLAKMAEVNAKRVAARKAAKAKAEQVKL